MIRYQVTQPQKPENELWDELTTHRLKGGFNIVGFNSFAHIGGLPKGIPLSLDHVARTATPIKGAILQAAVAATDTTMRLVKNASGAPLFVVGDFIGNATNAVLVTAVDPSNAGYDLITLSGQFGSIVAIGSLVLSAKEAGAAKVLKAHALNYAFVKWEPGKSACAAIIRAYEVRNGFLPYPLSVTQQTELTSRFYVVA